MGYAIAHWVDSYSTVHLADRERKTGEPLLWLGGLIIAIAFFWPFAFLGFLLAFYGYGILV